MSTQWARFHVFVQSRTGEPYQDYGSIHAPDAEIALLNARDVFARRPECVSMWVVPAEVIFSKTTEEIQNFSDASFGQAHDEPAIDMLQNAIPETYHVACKFKHTGTQTLIGNVEAISPSQAMGKALQKYSEALTALVWWVFPANLVTQNDPAEVESLYEPARDKGFRLSTDFHTHTKMRELKDKG